MSKFITKNKFILVLAALIICLSAAYGITVKLDPTVNAATQDTSATDYSWTSMSQAAAQYLGQTIAPDGTHGRDVNVPSSSQGFTGAFLGYMSPNSTDSRFTVGSLESANTVTYAYGTLEELKTSFEVNGNEWSNSALVYAGYGYALTESGIDEPVIIGQTNDDKRNLIGPIVLIIFLLCMALPKFFELVLTFLSVANPFKLFLGSGSVLYSITPGIDAGPGFSNQNGTIAGIMGPALQSLANTITGLYNALYSLSFFAVVPIMIGIALFSWLVLRQKTGSVFKKLLIRVVFIGLGVPLMLACYTAAIDSVKDFTINTSTGTPVSVISSTFCDYGSWALGRDNGLFVGVALPTGANLKVDQSDSSKWSYDNNSSTSDRKLVAIINAAATNNVLADSGLNSAMSAENIAADSSALVNSVAGLAGADKTSAVINLLQRYTKGEYITAGNYATKINNGLNRQSSTAREAYMKSFNLSNNWKDFDPNKAVAFKYEANDGTSFAVDVSEADAKSFAQGRLTGAGSGVVPNNYNLFNTSLSGGSFSPGNYTGYAPAASLTGAYPPFSPMAVYNLLSSTFSDSAVTVYSTAATSTNQVQLAHYAVSIAGKGYLELAYVFDACAIMACLMVLGYGYGFALLFGCFRGLIQMFPKVLTGMIGSIKGIAGALALTAALIIEVIGTCIMYALGTLVIGSIYDLIEIPVAKLLTTFVSLPSQAAALITVVASGIIIIKLTTLLLKYRTAVVKATTESATSFINKFLETNVVAPNVEGDITGRDIAGAALGTAMVLGSVPGGNKLADRATEGLSDKLNNLDGEKVATATMTGGGRTGDHGEKYASSEAKQQADKLTEKSGGAYVDNGASASTSDDTPKTEDSRAADYVASNEDDFENEIGYAGTGSSHSVPAAAAAGDDDAEYDADDKEIRGSKLADNNDDLKDQGFMGNETGKVTNEDGSVEEYKNGKLVAAYDANGKKIVDNSTEELTGTRTTDVTGTEAGDVGLETDGKTTKSNSKLTSGGTADSSSSDSAGKFVMTDANGNTQEVQIVNAKTGKAYTQADKDAGANYDVIDANGKSVYPNLQGGMSSNTLAMANGEPTVMVGPGSNGTSAYGGGSVYQLSAPAPAPVPAPEVAAPVNAAPGDASQVNQPVTQHTTQNIVNTNNDNTSTSNIQNTTQNTSESVMQNVTQGDNGGASLAGGPVIAGQGSAPVIVNQGSGSTPNVNVSVADRGVSTPSQTTVQQDFVQNITNPVNAGNSGMSGGSTVVNNTYNTQNAQNTYNTQHTQNAQSTYNTQNHESTSNNINVSSGSDRDRAGLGTGRIPNNSGRRV